MLCIRKGEDTMEIEELNVTIHEEKISEPETKTDYEKLDEQLMQTFPASDPLTYY
jgi:hypothetical protein